MPFVNGQYQADTRSPMQRLFDVQKMQAQMQQLRAQQDLEEQRKRILQESYTPAQDARTEYSFDQPQAPQQPVSFAGSAPNIAAALGIADVPQMQAKQIEGAPAAFDAKAAIDRLYSIGDMEGAQQMEQVQEKKNRDLNRWSGSPVYIEDPENPGVTIAVQPSTQGDGEAYRKIGVTAMTPEARARLEQRKREEEYQRQKDARQAQFEREKFNFQKSTSGQSTQQPSEDERKAAGWVAQARTSMQNMQDALMQDPSADSPSTGEKLAGVFGAEGAVQSEARQRYATAASSFAEAALRAATGAGVNEQEAKQKINELTPTYFDKPATKEQKWRQLQMYLDSLEARAGRALPMVKVPTPGGQPAPQAKPAASAPKPGTMKGGYVFMGGNPADPKSWRKM